MNDDCVCEAEPLALARGACGARGVRRRGKGVRGAALAAGPARYLRPPLCTEPARLLPARASSRPPAGGAAAVVSAGPDSAQVPRGRAGGSGGRAPPAAGPARTCAPRAGDMVGGGAACGAEAGRAERAACGAVEKCRRRRRGRGAQRGEGAGRAARRGGGGHGPDYTDTNSQAALKE